MITPTNNQTEVASSEQRVASRPKPKKVSARDKRADLLIHILVNRGAIASNATSSYLTASDRASNDRRMRDELAKAQFELEKSLIKSLGLDHLDGIEGVYGIKRRIPSWERNRVVAASAA